MKLNTLKSILFIFTVIILTGCNSSEKGKWSEAEKEKFRQDMNAIEELSNFGENKTKWIECYLSKCEATYPSYKEANKDAKGTEKLGFDCAREVLSDPKR